jgi:hypothetical protein
MNCWAAKFGGCATKQSREHLVSQTLFKSTEVKVQGFPWCKDAPKTIGLASAVGKILCVAHNSQLSAVDTAGGEGFDVLREVQRLQNVRGRLKPQRWKIARRSIDGLLLERWFLKTSINLALSSRADLRWDIEDTPLEQPPLLLLEVAFGLRAFEPHMGLYAAGLEHHAAYSDDTVQFAPVLRHGTHVVGAAFVFRGHQFLLSLIPERLPERVDFVTLPGFQGAYAAYHLSHMRFEIGGFLSQDVSFRWLP